MSNWIICFCLFLLVQFGFSQKPSELPNDTTRVFITLTNGTAYTGKIIDRNQDKILLRTEEEGITILRNDIHSVDIIGESTEMRIIMNDGKEHEGIILKSDEDQLTVLNKNGRITLQRDKVNRIEEQSEKEWIEIVMKDGTVYEGYRKTNGTEPATIYTENGKIEYNPSQVRKESKLQNTSKYGFENPIPTKYFLGPSAIPLKKGMGYYHNQAVIFNSFQTGLNDNISVGGGLEFISLFIIRSPLIYGNLKISASASDQFHYGGGVITGGVLGGDDFDPSFFVAPYGLITIGGHEHNITFGGSGVLARFPFGIFTLSGMTRVSRKVSLISNNYFAIGDFGFFPGFGIQGVRIMNKSNAFDIGLIISSEFLSEGFILPYAGFIQRF